MHDIQYKKNLISMTIHLNFFITFVVYWAKISRTSTVPSFADNSSKNRFNGSPQATSVGNIAFNLPDVNVGDNLARRFLHFSPPNENKCPDSGSFCSSMMIPRS